MLLRSRRLTPAISARGLGDGASRDVRRRDGAVRRSLSDVRLPSASNRGDGLGLHHLV